MNKKHLLIFKIEIGEYLLKAKNDCAREKSCYLCLCDKDELRPGLFRFSSHGPRLI